jgi:thiol:disulfide interchange protein DsbD
MKSFLKFTLFLISILILSNCYAQMVDPVKWKLSTKKISDCEYELRFTATIEEHWHVYSLNSKGDGPMPTKINLKSNKEFDVIGSSTESTPIKEFDKVFEMDVAYFDKTATFKQKIKLKTTKETVIKGTYEYQACNDVTCTFPPPEPFEFKLQGTDACGDTPPLNEKAITPPTTIIDTHDSVPANAVTPTTINNNESSIKPEAPPTEISQGKEVMPEKEVNYWGLFFKGFLGGLAALLTPCVFPMIPMTVSFFTKRSKTRAKGISNAIIYGLSIILIYVTLGLGVSFAFGSDALNALSTNVWFNMFFFFMLLFFAASFLGAFEIVLPSKFVNKIDSQSDRGGIIGIFFMAMTLSVVSFSCTGPVVGPLLVDAAVNGGFKGPFTGMLGFSTALAFPFALFAMFPGWLNSLPKSGGWLNSVKVTLGFLELAFAFKFASNADLVVQAGILTREIFIALWIVIFGLLGMYLMGWFKLSHDSDVKYISVTRLFFAVITLSFTIYLIPGLWGAPLKLISGFPPPDFYSESPQGFGGSAAIVPANGTIDAKDNKGSAHKSSHCPNQLPCFHDYDEALAYAKEVKKPLMVDFTGWACVNCRKMESQVWVDPEVDKRIRNEVVLVSLYVDDKTELPIDQQMVKKLGDRDFNIKTIGNKWSYMQADRYKTNTQPQYILLDNNEQTITKEPAHYDPNIQEYINWLDEGINEYKKRNKTN